MSPPHARPRRGAEETAIDTTIHRASTGEPGALHPPDNRFDTLAVFCGAANGARAEYADDARRLGGLMARRGIRLLYGGGRAGMMGAVADGCLDAGGAVTGVIPGFLVGRELAHPLVKDMVVVETMHERKMTMAKRADAFVALPGGLGTLDEMFEILAWAQLGLHGKPVGLLNTRGYYDSMMAFLDHVEREGFLRLSHRAEILFDADVESLLDRLERASAKARPAAR
ncbi:MAG: TIGR00730 family Rossman fold protein [Phycisphaerae bacterium]|nr:TIGR00730 family Rossman fold protein [Phycisphaerae bacterium]